MNLIIKTEIMLLFMIFFIGCSEPEFDFIIINGIVYDGSGTPGQQVDVGIKGDRITAIGDLGQHSAKEVIDAKGLAVSPGFINMLSWATTSFNC